MNIEIIIVIVLIIIIVFLYTKNKSEGFATPVSAQYIRIEGGPNFTLSEVQVLDLSGNNILQFKGRDLGETISFSQKRKEFTYKNIDDNTINVLLEKGGFYSGEYGLPYIVDGRIDTNFGLRNFFHGDGSLTHSILINLGKEYKIKEIKIHPRWHGNYLDRLNNTKVTLFNKTQDIVYVRGKVGDKLTIEQEIKLMGKVGDLLSIEQEIKEIKTNEIVQESKQIGKFTALAPISF